MHPSSSSPSSSHHFPCQHPHAGQSGRYNAHAALSALEQMLVATNAVGDDGGGVGGGGADGFGATASEAITEARALTAALDNAVQQQQKRHHEQGEGLPPAPSSSSPSSSPCGDALALYQSIVALRDYFHTVVCKDFLADRVMARLNGYGRRIDAVAARVAQARSGRREKQKGPAAPPVAAVTEDTAARLADEVSDDDQEGGGDTDVQGGGGHRCDPLTEAALRCKEERALCRAVGNEQRYGLLSVQRAAARVEAFVPQRIDPLRGTLFTAPTNAAMQHSGATRARQQAWLSRLSRSLHEERSVLDAAKGATAQLKAYVVTSTAAAANCDGGAPHHHAHDGDGSSWSDVSTAAVHRKLQAELPLEEHEDGALAPALEL